MNFGNNIAILRTARVTAPVVVLLLTLVLGFRFGSFDHSFSSTASPLEATFALGLPLFPAGVFFLLNGLVIRTQQRAEKNWPAVTGHVMETKYRLTYLRGGPFVDFWYAFNGKRPESYTIQHRHLPRSRFPFRPGMTVDVDAFLANGSGRPSRGTLRASCTSSRVRCRMMTGCALHDTVIA